MSVSGQPTNSPVLLQLKEATYYKANTLLFDRLNWTIREGENWAIVGNVGSGKTLLAEALTGELFLRTGEASYPFLTPSAPGKEAPHIREVSYLLSFQEESFLFRYANFYYQQRFHATETEGIITARDFLYKSLPSSIDSKQIDAICQRLGISHVLPLEFIKLSNGQTRKLRIARALLQQPALLVLDNPFVGLDQHSRQDLNELIDQLIAQGTHIILTSHTVELPQSITHILWLESLQIKGTYTKKDFLLFTGKQFGAKKNKQIHSPLKPQKAESLFQTAIQFTDVQVAYEGKKALQQINWKVQKGEKWALLGPNGSGKSTLLSLIAADHPQAYANQISLFDQKRGSGESIWDIKRRIGFVSPELHLYFKTSMTSREVAATGFFDTLTLNRSISGLQEEIIDSLFSYYSREDLIHKRFLHLSSGEQRIVLLIRSLVKHPDLVIWDEPFQSLDVDLIQQSTRLLDLYCDSSTTLLFVSHYAHEIPPFITKYLFLENGIIRKMEYHPQKI